MEERNPFESVESTEISPQNEQIQESPAQPDWKELVKNTKPEAQEENKTSAGTIFVRILSYLIVAALASAITLSATTQDTGYSKLEELKELILQCYIGDADAKYMEDAAAAAMVYATGDQWSYYIPAESLQSVMDQKDNSYVGIGVTINILEDNQGFQVERIEPDSPALNGGVQIGDIIVAVNGVSVEEVGSEKAQAMVSGKEGTNVTLTVSRDGQQLELALTRRRIIQAVATGKMVTDSIGYIRITNFNSRCADETIALFQQLQQQGATAMIFDVRFNPGGYKDEMVQVLDYLLPEGVLFRSEGYDGSSGEDISDASCQNMPMAVLINGESYSAAEFFAAALKEYDYAVTVGQPTTGKGYFQNTFPLSDGSAVNLSVGKYYTPKGVSLAEEGGLVPDVTVEVDQDTMAQIYAQALADEEDEQLQEAIRLLSNGVK